MRDEAVRAVISGNSGSGKSTLARRLAAAHGAALPDLDAIAREPHKSRSPEEQHERLEFPLAWVAEHYRRSGPMSPAGHSALFRACAGPRLHLRALPAGKENA